MMLDVWGSALQLHMHLLMQLVTQRLHVPRTAEEDHCACKQQCEAMPRSPQEHSLHMPGADVHGSSAK